MDSYFNARWYDPNTGRFTSLDPIKDGLNWYAYCANNPMRYTDPTGLFDIGEIAGGLGEAVNDVMNEINNDINYNDLLEYEWAQYLDFRSLDWYLQDRWESGGLFSRTELGSYWGLPFAYAKFDKMTDKSLSRLGIEVLGRNAKDFKTYGERSVNVQDLFEWNYNIWMEQLRSELGGKNSLYIYTEEWRDLIMTKMLHDKVVKGFDAKGMPIPTNKWDMVAMVHVKNEDELLNAIIGFYNNYSQYALTVLCHGFPGGFNLLDAIGTVNPYPMGLYPISTARRKEIEYVYFRTNEISLIKNAGVWFDSVTLLGCSLAGNPIYGPMNMAQTFSAMFYGVPVIGSTKSTNVGNNFLGISNPERGGCWIEYMNGKEIGRIDPLPYK